MIENRNHTCLSADMAGREFTDRVGSLERKYHYEEIIGKIISN